MYLMVEGQPVSVREGITRIGRSASADVRFEDASVANRHALLLRDGDVVRVLDDRSSQGVFVNGERVTARVLEDRDVVRIGRHELLFEAPATRPIAA